ncbi:MAG: hypothetical protein HS101_18835 [Planctomycetia bacterium]|jgi:hypothetical protein|nr:hypothetical protein [Planctomycetia bacterium]MCC7316306.1 hypothetical protein [Planctomycetota bacterium]
METGLWNECLSGITTNGCFIPSVSGIVEFQGDLIVSGSFDRAGDVSVSRVARWDGEGWAAMGEMGPGVATAFLEFDGKLFAGGNFPTGVGSERYGVRVWNNGAWDPVDVGFTSRRPFVSALSVFDGKLIAGGSDLFTVTTSNQCVAELTVDGWMPIGTGIQGNPVRALAVYDGKLVAAGQVFISGESGPTPGVIEWDGISWRRLGGGVTHQFFTQVNSLALFDGNLVVAGSFSGAGGVSVQNIAMWNGSSWLPMSHGLNRLTSAMTTFRGGLACGSGFFDSLSGRVSHGFSLWESQGPRFTSEPTSSWVCPSGTAAFSGTAEATGSAIYQWLRNGVELKDGGNISGATGPKLTIAAADLADEGEYSLRVSDNCGTSSSEPALLTVPCCGARPNGDLNHDGSTNGADIQIFIDSVLSGVRLAGSVCIADFNHDRLLDVQDVIPFADAMMQGN